MTALYELAVTLHDRAIADAQGDAAKALVGMSVEMAALRLRYRAAVSPGFVRDGLPKGQVGAADEPESL